MHRLLLFRIHTSSVMNMVKLVITVIVDNSLYTLDYKGTRFEYNSSSWDVLELDLNCLRQLVWNFVETMIMIIDSESNRISMQVLPSKPLWAKDIKYFLSLV